MEIKQIIIYNYELLFSNYTESTNIDRYWYHRFWYITKHGITATTGIYRNRQNIIGKWGWIKLKKESQTYTQNKSLGGIGSFFMGGGVIAIPNMPYIWYVTFYMHIMKKYTCMDTLN